MSSQKTSAESAVADAALPVNNTAPNDPPALESTLAKFLSKEVYRGSMPVSQIDGNPANRPYTNGKDLHELTASIRQYGVLQDIIIRPFGDARYQIVTGEQRFMAACAAGLPDVPCRVLELNDSEAQYIRCIENAQRRDLHPMEEAILVDEIIQMGDSVQETAIRLSKSVKWVYTRLTLARLTPNFREMFREAKIMLSQALMVAALAEDAQERIFQEYYSDWRNDKNLSMDLLERHINNCQNDLTRAPFDTKDAQMVPSVGACLGCQHNTATTASLFPHEKTPSICMRPACFQEKFIAHWSARLAQRVQSDKPEALLLQNPSETWKRIIQEEPAVKNLPQINWYDVTEQKKPIDPLKSSGKAGTAPNVSKEQQEKYDGEVSVFKIRLQTGTIRRGIHIKNDGLETVFFAENSKLRSNSPVITQTQLQSAIETNTVTNDMIMAGIESLQEREQRSRELDKEGLVKDIREGFEKWLTGPDKGNGLQPVDNAACWYCIWRSLSYPKKAEFWKKCGYSPETTITAPALVERFNKMTDTSKAFLVHLLLTEQPGSAKPSDPISHFFYLSAKSAGFSTDKIEKDRAQATKTRQENYRSRLQSLKSYLKKPKEKKDRP